MKSDSSAQTMMTQTRGQYPRSGADSSAASAAGSLLKHTAAHVQYSNKMLHTIICRIEHKAHV